MYLDDNYRMQRRALITVAAVVVALGIFGYWLLLGRPSLNVLSGAEGPPSPPSAAVHGPLGTAARGSAAERAGAPAGATPSGAAAREAEPTSSAVRGAAAEPEFAEDAARAATGAPPDERQRGEPIALRSRPGVLLTVKRVEWHDRMQVEEGEGTRYVDPAMGGFLVVVFEIANQTTGAIGPAEVPMPVLEDGAGDRYQPSPPQGVVVVGQQPLGASGRQSIAPGSTATRVEFFDVPLDFADGALRSEVDNYRVPVGRAH